MAEHLQRFVENRIDLSVLPDPTDQDLEKLAALLGDRRKMLGAIRDLDSVSVAPAAVSMPVAHLRVRWPDRAAARYQLVPRSSDLDRGSQVSRRSRAPPTRPKRCKGCGTELVVLPPARPN
jgi:hypothetical protein